VLRRDFLAVLESDRGSANHLKPANNLGKGVGDSCPDASTE
jgi:hypothetical protein